MLRKLQFLLSGYEERKNKVGATNWVRKIGPYKISIFQWKEGTPFEWYVTRPRHQRKGDTIAEGTASTLALAKEAAENRLPK